MKKIVFLLFTLFSRFAFAESGRICFFEDINYRGASFCVVPGVQEADLSRTGWNHRISSIAIQGEAAVELFSAFNFSGSSVTLSVSRPNLRGEHFNDVASSFRTGRPQPQACFFQDINYGGNFFCLVSGREIPNLKSGNWNDKISSVKIIGDASAYIYLDIGFGGRMLWIRTSTPNLVTRGWNDKASSVIVAKNAGR